MSRSNGSRPESANIPFENVHLIGCLDEASGRATNSIAFTKRIRFPELAVGGFAMGIDYARDSRAQMFARASAG